MNEIKVQLDYVSVENIAEQVVTGWLEYVREVESVIPESRLYYWRIYNGVSETEIDRHLKSRLSTLVALVLNDCYPIRRLTIDEFRNIFTIRSNQVMVNNYLPEEFEKTVLDFMLKEFFLTES